MSEVKYEFTPEGSRARKLSHEEVRQIEFIIANIEYQLKRQPNNNIAYQLEALKKIVLSKK